MVGQLLVWAIVVVFVLAALVVGVVMVARRRRATEVVDPAKQLQRARRAVRQSAKASRSMRRGSIRGTGTAADSSNEAAASYDGQALM
ncbi:MAG: hypothetical protein J2P17_03400 [Mycobacterium sp.]|nr:hypothetical protein [Mycobacterium sp.]